MLMVLGVGTVATIIYFFGWYLYQSVHNRRVQPFEDPHVGNQENDHDMGDCSEGDNVHGNEGSSNDPVLDPKHKIFLSHSGAQKEFVEHLCKALEDRCLYPFFDRRHECLPKGERFPELIVQAAEQCEMLIVVVSNEYFMSKWPMIELSAFVKAHNLHHGSNIGPKILPLFYSLSVSDLDNEGMQKKWLQEWKTLAKADPKKRIVVSDWKYAFNALRSFNGLPYDKNLKEVVAYEDKIVSYVCKSIAPDIKWDDSHVQGKSSIYKVIGEKIERTGVSKKYNVKVVGIYGVGGIGKTTTCKTLCNEVSRTYEGRVCHIEFPIVPSSDSKELFQKVLQDLIRKSMEVIQKLNEGECKDILRKSLFKQKTFLAIDNISDHHQSIRHAKTFLEFHYHRESLVVVTARSLGALELLGLDGDACLEMPDLGEVEAVNLFLHHAVGGKQFFEVEERRDIMTCINRCYFSKGNGQGHHYHPLVLQALGLQLGCHGEKPSLWVKNLPRVKDFNFFSGGNPVFDILRSSFDLLPQGDQTLFMDVGRFSNWISFSERPIRIEWLCTVHMQDEEKIILRLEHLKRKGLLQDVDLRSGRISIHDLYLEFAELEAMGSFNEPTNLRKWMCVYLENNDFTKLKSKPEGGCWHKLIRLSIIQSSLGPKKHEQIVGRIQGFSLRQLSPLVGITAKANFWRDEAKEVEIQSWQNFAKKNFPGQIGGMKDMKWDYFSNVEVLQLSGLHWGQGALNLEVLLCLRILELHDLSEIDRVEGLEKLQHLTYFVWKSDVWAPSSSGMDAHIVGQLPSSLEQLIIWRVRVILESDLLVQCLNLSKLELCLVEALSLDLSNFSSLESVSLREIRKLHTLSGLAACLPSSLHSLTIYDCEDLVDIPGIDHLVGTKKLDIELCPKYEVTKLCALTELQVLSISSELCAFTELQVLSISGEQSLVVPAKDCFPRQLRELRWRLSRSSKGLNLTGFNQLEVLDLTDNDGLTSLAELGDLPALRRLGLGYCEHLLRLRDFSKSRNLKEIELNGCSALELLEEDIQMLSKLPFLQPVPFSGLQERGTFRLDLAQGKVLVHSSTLGAPRWEFWKAGEWEERDLGTPLIKIGRRGTWELDQMDSS